MSFVYPAQQLQKQPPILFSTSDGLPPLEETSSPQETVASRALSSSTRTCSVKNCSQELSPDYSGKMCETCRSRHRVYASTKRAKRRVEKRVMGAQSSGVVDTQAVFMPLDAPSASEDLGPSVDAIVPSSLEIPAESEHLSLRPRLPPTAPSHLAWDPQTQIDPRLFPSSTSELAGALTLPCIERSLTLEQCGEDPPNSASSLPPRYCSIKGCKRIISGDYLFKMCQPCRTRYRAYGTVKRTKWKENRETTLAKLTVQYTEAERINRDGLLATAHVSEQPQVGHTSSPPRCIRMCSVSHCHSILPENYQFRRCNQHRAQNRHHSKLKRAREKEEKSLPIIDERATERERATYEAMKQREAAQAMRMLAEDEEVDYDPLKGIPPPARGARRTNHICGAFRCHNVLAPHSPWRMCEVHREKSREARKRRAERDKVFTFDDAEAEAEDSAPSELQLSGEDRQLDEVQEAARACIHSLPSPTPDTRSSTSSCSPSAMGKPPAVADALSAIPALTVPNSTPTRNNAVCSSDVDAVRSVAVPVDIASQPVHHSTAALTDPSSRPSSPTVNFPASSVARPINPIIITAHTSQEAQHARTNAAFIPLTVASPAGNSTPMSNTPQSSSTDPISTKPSFSYLPFPAYFYSGNPPVAGTIPGSLNHGNTYPHPYMLPVVPFGQNLPFMIPHMYATSWPSAAAPPQTGTPSQPSSEASTSPSTSTIAPSAGRTQPTPVIADNFAVNMYDPDARARAKKRRKLVNHVAANSADSMGPDEGTPLSEEVLAASDNNMLSDAHTSITQAVSAEYNICAGRQCRHNLLGGPVGTLCERCRARLRKRKAALRFKHRLEPAKAITHVKPIDDWKGV